MVGGEGDGQFWGSGRGAIAGCHRCHCSVLWLGGRVLGPIAGSIMVSSGGWCHCSCRVPLWCAMVGGEGDDQVWGSGRGAIAGCHCMV